MTDFAWKTWISPVASSYATTPADFLTPSTSVISWSST